MPNITVTLTKPEYRAARVWTAERNTSISAIVQFCLQNLPVGVPAGLQTKGRWLGRISHQCPPVTITVSESAYHEARLWAARNDTSVTALVRYCLRRMPRLGIAQRAAEAIARKAKKLDCNAASEGQILGEIKSEGCDPVNQT